MDMDGEWILPTFCATVFYKCTISQTSQIVLYLHSASFLIDFISLHLFTLSSLISGDEDSPSRLHLTVANSSPVAAAQCSGDINAVNVPKAVNHMSTLGSTDKSKTGNVTVEAGSQLQLIQQGYASDDSEDEEHTGASSNPVPLPQDNEPSQPSDRNTEIGHHQVTNAEENMNAAQDNKLKDERNPTHSSDELGYPVKDSLSGSESVGLQQSERQGRIQPKRIRSQSPQARRSPSGENKHSPSPRYWTLCHSLKHASVYFHKLQLLTKI
jgi:hypothetical protein